MEVPTTRTVPGAPRIPGYDVLGRIGAGGSAQVWRARRVADDLDVALKVVATGPERLSPALREAGLLAAVRHQHVVHLYDVVPLPGRGGRPDGIALAMELAEGGSLAEVLGARHYLTPGELVTVCSPLAGALAELHRSGVVHGDVSPGNVLFRSDGMPLLADLGVSRIAGERRAHVHGTDGMVAPEVVEGFEPSAESDVYAVGALAWRCLVGEPPGWVGTRQELAELRPELPEGLVDLVTACLSGEPGDRPEAEEVAVALFAAARPEPIALAPGADPAAGLTQRIRADLRGEPDPGADNAPAGVDRRDRRLRVPHPRALLRAREGERRRFRLPRRLRPVLAGAGGVALVALLVNGLLGVLLSGAPAETADATDSAATAASMGVRGSAEAAPSAAGPQPPVPAQATDPAGSPGTATASARPTGAEEAPPEGTAEAGDGPAAPPEVTTGRTRPEEELRGAAQHLLDIRAAAWRSGDPAELEAVHLAGSPAYEQEQESLTTAADLDVRYEGLEFTVGAVEVLASGPERAVLEAEVDRSTYREVSPNGQTTHEPRSDVVELELRRADGEWRIWGWGATSAS